jgi:DNA-directed RNA polymerase specialized sigma24 family protein
MLSPDEVLRIARSEVHRACRKHPYWRPLFDDLVQDACEAVYLGGAPADGAKVRMKARGAVYREARYYYGMTQRGKERPRFAPVDLEAPAPPAPSAYEAENFVAGVLRFAAPRTRGLLVGVLEERSIKDIAAAAGLSRQGVYDHLMREQGNPVFKEAA